MEGGGGVWGVVKMPANPQVNEAEAKKLVAWVLSL
jgi:cytochrome c